MKVFTSTDNTGNVVVIPAKAIVAIEVVYLGNASGEPEWILRLDIRGRTFTMARGSQSFVTRQYELLMDELCGGTLRKPSPWGGAGYEHIIEYREEL